MRQGKGQADLAQSTWSASPPEPAASAGWLGVVRPLSREELPAAAHDACK